MAVDKDMIAALQAELVRKIEQDSLSLPAYPGIARDAQQQLQDAAVDLVRVGKTIARDPLLAVQILRLANSPLYRGVSEIDSLPQALSRIGVMDAMVVIYAAVAQTLFSSRLRRVNEILNTLWEHSLAVAHVARHVHQLTGREAAGEDAVFLAGLLHDVGQPIAAIHLVERERNWRIEDLATLIDNDGWLEVVHQIHRPVAAALARAWRLPGWVSELIKEPLRYDFDNEGSPCNAVHFANAFTKQLEIYVGEVDHALIDAQVSQGQALFGFDESVMEAIAAQARLCRWH